MTEEGEAAAAFVGNDDEGFEVADAWASLSPLLKQIPERERKILILRFFHDLTQHEIASELGISQMHVSRLLGRTLTKLRTIVGHVED
jgi:RNA polymerase sigma-B factor